MKNAESTDLYIQRPSATQEDIALAKLRIEEKKLDNLKGFADSIKACADVIISNNEVTLKYLEYTYRRKFQCDPPE